MSTRRGFALLIVAGTAVVGACGGDDDRGADTTVTQADSTSSTTPGPTGPDTTVVATTAPTPTTATVPATSPSTSPTTSPPPSTSLPSTTAPPPDDAGPVANGVTDDRWSPTCVEVVGGGSDAGATADGGLDTFGPLGPVPGLDIVVPTFGDASVVPNVGVRRVDGGVVIIARPYDGDVTDAYMLTLVDDDGAVRWRRCGSDGFAGHPFTAPGGSQIAVPVWSNTAPGPTWRSFDVATGVDGATDWLPTGMTQWTIDEQFAVFTIGGEEIMTADDEFAVVDLSESRTEFVPYLPEAGVPAFQQEFDVVEQPDGTHVVLAEEALDRSVIRGVHVDGEWRTDDDTILDTVGIVAVNTFDDARGWEGRNGLGEVVWSRPDLLDLHREGFNSGVSDGTTVVNACRDRDSTTFECSGDSLIGLDTAAGETLWERTGSRGVTALGDGFALITNDAADGWELIATETGEVVDETQRWPGIPTFAQECCGAGDFVWVDRSGGVVFAVSGDRIRVWYPQGRTEATITMSITD